MNDTFTSMYVTGQHKNKQISDRLFFILPICINTHGQYTTPTCPKCAYKISQIFSRVFEFALAEKPRNPRKLMYREYFHVYSICQLFSIYAPPPWSTLKEVAQKVCQKSKNIFFRMYIKNVIFLSISLKMTWEKRPLKDKTPIIWF